MMKNEVVYVKVRIELGMKNKIDPIHAINEIDYNFESTVDGVEVLSQEIVDISENF
jgi:hypothetical protein